MLKKIISGGQSGADQAGLDAAIKNNLAHGGAIPKGRLTEDGILPEKYNLDEMTSKSYPKRTEKNILDSDGTAIFTHGKLTGGSLLTRKKGVEHNKPVVHINLSKLGAEEAALELNIFIRSNNIEVLNVAGSRASKDDQIYGAVFQLIDSTIEMNR